MIRLNRWRKLRTDWQCNQIWSRASECDQDGAGNGTFLWPSSGSRSSGSAVRATAGTASWYFVINGPRIIAE